ncbi:zinc dependent phospholipase C family protein [Intestinibacter sp.]|uniref:zinc dependent phospholipase C family protein n=1 Tax=Intestinibacter sp. TaxID=1965304 RepID=UPI003F18890C
MILNTHLTISQALIENLDPAKSFFLSEKNFIYGNIKPDMTSKYVLHKHYLKESFDMIINKIKSLCKLSLDFIEKYFSVSKFSQELGVICHFLCDFFCVPHSQRWEFSHSFKKHVIYERDLQIVTKETDFSKLERDPIHNIGVEEFFNRLYRQYVKGEDFKNDLFFSTYMCNSVVDYILDCILENTVKSYSLQICS